MVYRIIISTDAREPKGGVERVRPIEDMLSSSSCECTPSHVIMHGPTGTPQRTPVSQTDNRTLHR